MKKMIYYFHKIKIAKKGMFRLNWFKLADRDFKLLPSFLNVQFKDDQGDISICDWIETLYQAKQCNYFYLNSSKFH